MSDFLNQIDIKLFHADTRHIDLISNSGKEVAFGVNKLKDNSFNVHIWFVSTYYTSISLPRLISILNLIINNDEHCLNRLSGLFKHRGWDIQILHDLSLRIGCQAFPQRNLHKLYNQLLEIKIPTTKKKEKVIKKRTVTKIKLL